MMSRKYKILFLGETYRADAITWMNGLKEFGPFELITWELCNTGVGLKKAVRIIEIVLRIKELSDLINKEKPDLIIAERITSYGFIASLFRARAPIAIAQQGITDIYPLNSIFTPLKRFFKEVAFQKADIVHAWGEVMTYSMIRNGCRINKIMVLAKGIDLRIYKYKPEFNDNIVTAIVTRSLASDYRHEIILMAFKLLKNNDVKFRLVIVGDGPLMQDLKQSAISKGLENEVVFTGRISNDILPDYLMNSDLYISMPSTEGFSTSFYEALACGCYPMLTKLPAIMAKVNDGENGDLIKVDDYQELARRILIYAKNRTTYRSKLDKNRRMVESEFSFEKNMKIISEKYVNLIESCVE